jgi:hypothetical protein
MHKIDLKLSTPARSASFAQHVKNVKIVFSFPPIRVTRSRCYDHNFLQFLTIFGVKNDVFLNNQCYDQNFALFSFVLRQKRHFFLICLAKMFLKS